MLCCSLMTRNNQARMLCRRFSEDDWEVLRSRVRRLGRSGSPVTGPLAADKGFEAEGQREAESAEQDVAHEHQTAPMLLNRLVQQFLTPSQCEACTCSSLTAISGSRAK